MPVFAAVAIVVLLCGGTSFAAERALPGDPLYSVKVGFNEKIVAALQVTPEAKTSYEADLASRRLDEAAELAARGEVSNETNAELEQSFSEHSARAKEGITAIQAEGNVELAADLASRFETQLRVHENVLTNATSTDSENTPSQPQVKREEGTNAFIAASSVTPGTPSLHMNVTTKTVPDAAKNTGREKSRLSRKVQNVLRDIGGLRASIESDIAGGAALNKGENKDASAAEAKVNAAANVVAESRVYIQKQKGMLGTDISTAAEARLKVADNLLIQAKAKISAGAFGEAFNLGNQAIRVAQEARLLIRAKTELKAKVDFESEMSSSADHISNTDAGHSEKQEGDDAGINADANINGGTDGHTETKGSGNLNIKLEF